MRAKVNVKTNSFEHVTTIESEDGGDVPRSFPLNVTRRDAVARTVIDFYELDEDEIERLNLRTIELGDIEATYDVSLIEGEQASFAALYEIEGA